MQKHFQKNHFSFVKVNQEDKQFERDCIINSDLYRRGDCRSGKIVMKNKKGKFLVVQNNTRNMNEESKGSDLKIWLFVNISGLEMTHCWHWLATEVNIWNFYFRKFI